jgi:hypothetical protein
VGVPQMSASAERVGERVFQVQKERQRDRLLGRWSGPETQGCSKGLLVLSRRALHQAMTTADSF